MNPQQRDTVFWAAAAILVAVKLTLVADLSVEINYAPHDDSLYVERAYHLLRGEGFGPYDSRTLIKYPGLSFWLAASRSLGLPYFISMQLLYAGAGLYFVSALVRCGYPRKIALLAFAVYLFNPITLGLWWSRVLREPLSTGLFVLMLGGWLHFLNGLQEGRSRIAHGIFAGIVFGFALYVREDDRLLWGFLTIVSALCAWQIGRAKTSLGTAHAYRLGAAVVATHIAIALSMGYAYRQFVEHHYGLPIIQDLSEGEFPKLMAAIRSVKSVANNRMVMAPQDVLRKLHAEVPAFSPVIDRLPPPGPLTLSCKLHGVCTEWSNGWMLYWIKDGAHAAGFAPDLPAAQSYFRSVRESIDLACNAGRLSCEPAGKSLIPPMELRWTRAYLDESMRLLALAVRPDPALISHPAVRFPVSVDLGRRYRAVTMTHYFDTEWQTSFVETPSKRLLVNPFAGWRARIANVYTPLSIVLFMALVLGLIVRAVRSVPFECAFAVCAMAMIFLLLRTLALAYVAVFMGSFDARMVLTSYAVVTLVTVPVVASAFALRRRKRTL